MDKKVDTYEIHPAAEAYRLMDDDELNDLAGSIAKHGLRDPITIGMIDGSNSRFIIDGRNRLAACEIAGVEPRYEQVSFASKDELCAFVLDRNERRNITKGQKAMAHAMLFPEDGGKGGRGKKSQQSVRQTDQSVVGFGRELLRQARAVLAYPQWVKAVRDGTRKPTDHRQRTVRDLFTDC